MERGIEAFSGPGKAQHTGRGLPQCRHRKVLRAQILRKESGCHPQAYKPRLKRQAWKGVEAPKRARRAMRRSDDGRNVLRDRRRVALFVRADLQAEWRREWVRKIHRPQVPPGRS